MLIDRTRLVQTMKELVSIPSVNPTLGPGEGEAEAADFVASALRHAGLAVEIVEPERGRTSVVGTLEGREPGPTLMLNGHLDTVPPGEMSHPFAPRLEGDRLFGRGACDMKGGVAACIAAAEAIANSDAAFAGALQVSAVADEEHASLGTRAVLEGSRPNAVVVAEPTGLVPCSAHRGFAWIEIRTRGRAAHGSRPDLGVDANLMMGRVLSALERMNDSLRASEPHVVVGAGSQHVGRLKGGGVWSVYADRSVLGLERRTIPGETGAGVAREIEEILTSLRQDDPDFEGEVELMLERPTFDAGKESPLREALLATGLTRGRGKEQRGVSFWTDAAFFAQAGADVVVLGPDGKGAHADVEWVDVDSVARLADLLARAAVDYLSPRSARKRISE